MKNYRRSAVAAAALMLAASAAFAYQVTGPVLDVDDRKIVVQKGKEKWEIARDRDTKGPKDIKKGSRVTVEYRMHATSIDVKDAPKAEKKGADKSAKDAKK